MPRLGPVSRRDLIETLRRAGFSGPYQGGRHEFMARGSLHLILPNPHGRHINVYLLARILNQVGITREEWASL
ncbi:MAG: type II toxin-antitoxin system HicA family toxin [Chloroflexi bacterium]|nr:type II toxin-antitoxin system HicA family toxin [Chloroflexota bacterium]